MRNRECILKLIDKNSIVVEVGVWKGDFSKLLYKKNPKKLILIDPWKSMPDLTGRWYSIDQEKMESIFKSVEQEFQDKSNVQIIRDYSLNVYLDEKVDLVYIDGNHSYDSVKKDLNHWWDKIKSGGYMTGDDYSWKDKHCNIGPKKAIIDFCKTKKISHETVGDQWIIKKI